MKTVLTTISFLALLQSAVMAQDISISADITLKSPGNPAETFSLSETRDGILVSDRTLPVEIGRKTVKEDGLTRIELTITAEDLTYYNIGQTLHTGFGYEDCLFYMPGF